jgi:phosphatidylserine/phosphatidylglycerophosphate/cardiolipin synthase-like enzyme
MPLLAAGTVLAVGILPVFAAGAGGVCRLFARGRQQPALLRLAVAGCLVFLWLPAAPAAGAPPARAYFSPNGGAERAIVAALDGAAASIEVAMYAFTSRVLAKALLRARKRGVKIRVVLDGNDESEYSKGFYLLRKGIDLRYTRGRRRRGRQASYGLMHDKFAVIDHRRVLTGSYNWTASAEKYNYENLLVLDSRPLAAEYEREFDRIWQASFRK